jgi:uncharacterized protein (TIGR02611 family)
MLLRTAKRVVVFVIGTTVFLIGVAMLVLPGPGTLGIVAGLALLATEFAWARRFLRQVKARIASAISPSRADLSAGRPQDDADSSPR